MGENTDRYELRNATLHDVLYNYRYDNAGNREMKIDGATFTYYNANPLNQYSQVSSEGSSFTPTYDADGNQTKVKTTTGIWNVVYSTDKRPIRFTSEEGQTVVECGYDYKGRRHSKKVTKNGVVTLHEGYAYHGFLQLAALDLRNGGNLVHFLLWDSLSRKEAHTLAIIQGGQVYCCVHDHGKNVTELLDSQGSIAATYDYLPCGEATAAGTVNSPVQWSNEVYDAELGLVYYNYRHYNPMDGRWISRDPIGEQNDPHLYRFAGNGRTTDYLGLSSSSLFDCFPIDSIILLPEEQERQKKVQDEMEEAKKKQEEEKKKEIEKGKQLPPTEEKKEEYPFSGEGSGDYHRSDGGAPSFIHKAKLVYKLDENNQLVIESSSDRDQKGNHPTTTKATGTHKDDNGNTWTGTVSQDSTGTTVQVGAEIPIIPGATNGPIIKVGGTYGPGGTILEGEVSVPVNSSTSAFLNTSFPIGGADKPTSVNAGIRYNF